MAELEELWALIEAMQEYDPPLLAHSLGVTNIVWQIALCLDIKEEFTLLSRGALLHDVGKTMLEKSILQKQGPLSPEEQEIMKRHPVDGARMLAGKGLGQELQEIVLYHHEHWDGKGYQGLAGGGLAPGAAGPPHRPRTPVAQLLDNQAAWPAASPGAVAEQETRPAGDGELSPGRGCGCS